MIRTFEELQQQCKGWTDHNFPKAEPWQPLLGAAEEIGELCHAHLKESQGIRQGNYRVAKEDAVGDTIVFLADYCNRNGLDLAQCVNTAWAAASRRDWVKYPVNGLTE